MRGAVVLASGGLDSTVLLGYVRDSLPPERVLALSVDYGQRHAREVLSAAAAAQHYGVEHVVADLASLGSLLGSALTTPALDVPEGAYDAPSMSATVVPNRNAILLMVAVGVASTRGFDTVLTAVHAGDHPVYADCRPEFARQADNLAREATEGTVGVHAPFVERTKADLVSLGHTLDVPLSLTWSCYQGGDTHCGRCGTCVERAEAFALAGVSDPTKYTDPAYWLEALAR